MGLWVNVKKRRPLDACDGGPATARLETENEVGLGGQRQQSRHLVPHDIIVGRHVAVMELLGRSSLELNLPILFDFCRVEEEVVKM